MKHSYKKVLFGFALVMSLVFGHQTSASAKITILGSGYCDEAKKIQWSLVADTGSDSEGGGVQIGDLYDSSSDEEIDGDIILSIVGSGEMMDYESEEELPWHQYINKLNRISVSDGITRIGNYAFYNARYEYSSDTFGAVSVSLPDTVTEIGDYAFYDVWFTDKFDIPTSVKMVGEYAFCDADWTVENGGCYNYGIESIGKGAFKFCDFGEIDLSACKQLGEQAFYDNRDVKNVILGKDISVIPELSFYYCEELEKVEIQNGSVLTRIDDRAFQYCRKLASINLPNSLQQIRSQAFSNCEALSEIKLPNGLEEIWNAAFMGTGLKELEIPASVTRLGGQVCDTPSMVKITVYNPECDMLYFFIGTVPDNFVCYGYPNSTLQERAERYGYKFVSLGVAPTTEATTEKKTETTTQVTTEKKTEITTQVTTEKKTEATTQVTTEKKTEATTEVTSEKTTEVTTEVDTEEKTEATTEVSTGQDTTEQPTVNPVKKMELESIIVGKSKMAYNVGEKLDLSDLCVMGRFGDEDCNTYIRQLKSDEYTTNADSLSLNEEGSVELVITSKENREISEILYLHIFEPIGDDENNTDIWRLYAGMEKTTYYVGDEIKEDDITVYGVDDNFRVRELAPEEYEVDLSELDMSKDDLGTINVCLKKDKDVKDLVGIYVYDKPEDADTVFEGSEDVEKPEQPTTEDKSDTTEESPDQPGTTEEQTPAKNMIGDENFEEIGTTWIETIANWSEEDETVAESSVKDGVITYDIQNAGTESWNVQLKQGGIKLEPGKTYKVSLDVVSTEGRSILCGVQNAEDYTQYVEDNKFELTKDENQTVTYTFTVADGDEAAELYISMGKVDEATPASKISISNVRLEEVTKVEEESDVEEPSSEEGTTQEPDTEKPTEQDTSEAPSTEKPNEPTTQAPSTEKPNEPTTQAPSTEKPTQPTTQAPSIQKPAQQPTTQAPSTQKPTAPVVKPQNNTSTSIYEKPSKVKGVELTNKKGKKLKIRWDYDEDGYTEFYEIQICTKRNFKKGVKTKRLSTNSLTWKNLKKKTTYYVRVRGVNKINGTQVGPWSSVKKIKIKK